MDELAEIKCKLEDGKTNPRDLKRQLARTFVRMYYDEQAAKNAEEEFDKIFIKKDVPDDIPEFNLSSFPAQINIMDLIVEVKFAPSKSEARRLVLQGGVSIDGEKINDIKTSINIKDGQILKVGKRKFAKLRK